MKTLPASDQGRHVPTVGQPQETPVAAVQLSQVNGLLRAFTALRHRNYRFYWFGQMISLIGTWMQTTGLAWLVLLLTHSAWQLGLVGAIQFLPVLVFAIFGGVFADRWPKRNVLVVTQSAAMVLAVLLWGLIATNQIQMWEVYVLALLLGLTNSLDMPTRQAFVVEMVGREDLPNAVALNSSLFNMARILGPGLGGLLIAWLGLAPLFLLNAISFIAVIIGLALIEIKELHTPLIRSTLTKDVPKQSTLHSFREGLAYLPHTPSRFFIIIVIAAISFFLINFHVILPLFATALLHSA